MKTKNRTFIISGGASGLGKACVEDLVKTGGANVAILDMSVEAGKSLASDLGASTRFFACNVLHKTSITTAVREAAQWAQETENPLAGVISAAGIAFPATILDRHGSAFNLGDIDMVLGVNLRGTIDLVRQAVEYIAKVDADPDGERGIVIMIPSAIASMTFPMARDLARYGIRCVTIAPSLFETNITSMMPHKVRSSLEATFEFPNRPGKPYEFAHLVRQSINNIMLNGTVIRIDGGSRPSKI